MAVEEKQPKTLAFKTYREALAAPGEFLLSDFSKLERSPLLHLAFQALAAFRKEVRPPQRPRPCVVLCGFSAEPLRCRSAVCRCTCPYGRSGQGEEMR